MASDWKSGTKSSWNRSHASASLSWSYMASRTVNPAYLAE